jgi:hypothetical protein
MSDPRGRKIAVVADSLLEQLLPELGADGFGMIQLPPAGLAPPVASEWLEQVAEHVAEFVRNGYEVVLAGDGTHEQELREKLDELGVSPLARYASRTASHGGSLSKS